MKKYSQAKYVLFLGVLLIMVFGGLSFNPTPAFASCLHGTGGGTRNENDPPPPDYSRDFSGGISNFSVVSLNGNPPNRIVTLGGTFHGGRTEVCNNTTGGYPTNTNYPPNGRLQILSTPQIPISPRAVITNFTEEFNVSILLPGTYTARLTIDDGINGDIWEDRTFTIPVPPMSGTISASDCEITAGSSSCPSNINWTTTNPVASSSVTTPTNITVATGLSGATTYSVAYGTRSFYLYNNSIQLATDPANATCATGTAWDTASSTCKTNNAMSGTLTANPSPCSIPNGGNSCSTDLTWSINKTEAVLSKITASGMTDITLVTPTIGGTYSGTQSSATVTHPSRIFYLYNNAKQLKSVEVSANCVSGTVWDTTSSTCKTDSSVSGTLTATDCTIPAGGSTCSVPASLHWTLTNPVGDSNITSNTPTPIPSGGNVIKSGILSSQTSGDTSAPFLSSGPSTRDFFLNNSSKTFLPATAEAKCENGSNWNGSICAATLACSLAATRLSESDPFTLTATGFNGTGTPPVYTFGYNCNADGPYDPNITTCTYSTEGSHTAWAQVTNNGNPAPPCSVVVTVGPGSVGTPGKCNNTDYYACYSSVPSTNHQTFPSTVKWTCPGTGGKPDDFCSKPKGPGFIEN